MSTLNINFLCYNLDCLMIVRMETFVKIQRIPYTKRFLKNMKVLYRRMCIILHIRNLSDLNYTATQMMRVTMLCKLYNNTLTTSNINFKQQKYLKNTLLYSQSWIVQVLSLSLLVSLKEQKKTFHNNSIILLRDIWNKKKIIISELHAMFKQNKLRVFIAIF